MTAVQDGQTPLLGQAARSLLPARRAAGPGVVLLLGALSAFGPLSTDMYLPALPSMAVDLAAPSWVIQLTLTTFFLGMAIGQLIVGPISDVVGRRRPLLVVLAGYAITSLFCAIAPNASVSRWHPAAARRDGWRGHRDCSSRCPRPVLGR